MPTNRVDVFISSTSKDLLDYREKVQTAVRKLGAFPIAMEEFTATERNAMQKCYDEVQNAEVFVGIYAYRYGFAPDADMTYTTKEGELRAGDGKTSITHWEYLWAKERKLPMLLYLIAEKDSDGRLVAVPPDYMDGDPGKTHLREFKEFLMGKHTIERFYSPDNLQANVTAALAPILNTFNTDALKPYLRWLHNESKKSGLLRVIQPRDAMTEGKSITVDQVYTPLDTRMTVYRFREDGRILTVDEVTAMQRGEMKDKEIDLNLLTAMESASRNNRLVLLGDPGSGKSTFVNFITLCLTGHALEPEVDWLTRLQDQQWKHGDKLPIAVTLRDFAQDVQDATEGNAKLLFDHLKRQLAKWQLETAYPSIERALERGEALVLLDGLDEVPPSKRDLVRDTITKFMERVHKDNRFIVTCRILSYTNPEWQIPNTVEYTIAPFDEDKVTHFIEAWYTALDALREIDVETAEKRISDLTEGLQHPHLQNVATNPMLLTVMTIVHNHTGTLPRESAKLYQQCVELLMMKWRSGEAKSLMETLDVREDDLYRMLWEIAYDAHDKQADREGAADITETAVIGIARKRLGDLSKSEAFCEYVEKRAGLLIGRGVDSNGWRVFTFPHRTFQEFLAGCQIASDRFHRRAPELARRGTGWREVIMLATGHLVFNRGDISAPLDAVDKMCPERFNPQNDDEWRIVALAGEMLALIGVANVENDDVGREVLPRVCAKLADLVGHGHLPTIERVAAGRSLGILGDPRFGVGVNANGVPEIDWVEISAGEFILGGDTVDPNINYLETFYISRYPITYVQFQSFVEAPDFYDDHWWDGMPELGTQIAGTGIMNETKKIENNIRSGSNYQRTIISWYQSIAFCRWLSTKLGYTVTLPTEAQWVKAARGIGYRIYPYGDQWDSETWNSIEAGSSFTSPVGIFPKGSSAYGVHDMGYGIFEWCLDTIESNRVTRGGHYGSEEATGRIDNRNPLKPEEVFGNQCFRIIRNLS